MLHTSITVLGLVETREIKTLKSGQTLFQLIVGNNSESNGKNHVVIQVWGSYGTRVASEIEAGDVVFCQGTPVALVDSRGNSFLRIRANNVRKI